TWQPHPRMDGALGPDGSKTQAKPSTDQKEPDQLWNRVIHYVGLKSYPHFEMLISRSAKN
ncbi:MAG: hypothetical protein K8F91_21810, partial [Candidatus Obscuribacterales bacterium]|nr:hypothetical protein [Candidatus Obscuribacterales bacterium]